MMKYDDEYDTDRLLREGFSPELLARIGPVPALRRAYALGKLPLERRCVQCEAETEHVLIAYVECLAARIEEPSYVTAILLFVFSPLRALLHYAAMNHEPTILDEGLDVRAPLRLCPQCSSKLRRRPKEVRALLLKMPIYQALFKEYPDAAMNIPNL